jgi:leucyl/phenylalanyl-tRNA--protein transferase
MNLEPDTLLWAYANGIFPMGREDGPVEWYRPDPRAILPLENLRVSHSLARTLRQKRYEIRLNTAFAAVIRACAAPAPDREETWITPEIIVAYERLHHLGYAHSVEAWATRESQNGCRLVGGLYGVALAGLFAGESMFSHQRDASKAALFYLVQHLRQRGFVLLDVQFLTPHLARMGAIEISAAAYQRRLAEALRVEAWFAESVGGFEEEER